MVCKNCGRETAGDSVTCPYCGAAADGNTGDLTMGTRVWFWIVLIGNILLFFSGFGVMEFSKTTGIAMMTGCAVIIAGAYMILFRHMKAGFYVIICAAVISLIFNLASNAGFSSIAGQIGGGSLAYYFLEKNKNILI